MTNRYEQRYLTELSNRIAASFPSSSIVTLKLSNWIEEQDLGFLWDPEIDRFARKGLPAAVWKDLRTRLAARLKRITPARADALSRNISALSDHMGLDEDETAIFTLTLRAARFGPVNTLCNTLTDDARLPVEDAVAILTGVSRSRVRKALAPSAKLQSCGLLHFDKPPYAGLGIQPGERLLTAMEPPSRGISDILASMFATVEPATVTWDDFEHIGPERDFALRLLKGALKRRERGVNILLHGAPGTGKTELCKVLAACAGANLCAVGESDDDGDEPSRFERMQQLRFGQRLLGDQGNTVILFDEMEDLFPALDVGFFGLPMRRTGSKVHMNRLLETNPAPTLWTTNSIRDCDPAFLRRFTFVLELRTPPIQVRARVWQKMAQQHQVRLTPELCLGLAESMAEAPALASSALRAARIADGGPEDVRLTAQALSVAVRGRRVPEASRTLTHFDPELANADHDLHQLTQRLVSCGHLNLGGLCLGGPPGTGKSAYARYLADQLEMPILERRASDLLDRYVGGSERNIADAFSEARDRQAFLIFDEADSLLGARGVESRRWEVSQVNEMLTWMEQHTLPFACTTNLIERLDPATARRFSLRVRFLPLAAAQREACFKRFFGCDAPARLAELDQLTPGDFAVVAKRVHLLGITEPAEIMTELRREHLSKPGKHNPIGFRASL
ncbi:MAG: AAA family ATPase [Phyllobacteriaceae bacterium]|nr:AAA family ATPase [Phyllobacteriaceae bacterium]